MFYKAAALHKLMSHVDDMDECIMIIDALHTWSTQRGTQIIGFWLYKDFEISGEAAIQWEDSPQAVSSTCWKLRSWSSGSRWPTLPVRK